MGFVLAYGTEMKGWSGWREGSQLYAIVPVIVSFCIAMLSLSVSLATNFAAIWPEFVILCVGVCVKYLD